MRNTSTLDDQKSQLTVSESSYRKNIWRDTAAQTDQDETDTNNRSPREKTRPRALRPRPAVIKGQRPARRDQHRQQITDIHRQNQEFAANPCRCILSECKTALFRAKQKCLEKWPLIKVPKIYNSFPILAPMNNKITNATPLYTPGPTHGSYKNSRPGPTPCTGRIKTPRVGFWSEHLASDTPISS